MVAHRKLFFLLLLCIPVQLAMHVWPDWAYILGRRVDYLSPTLYGTDLLLAMVICSWAVTDYGSFRPKLTKLSYISVGFGIVFIAANILFSTGRMTALYTWSKCLEYLLLIWYIRQTKPSWSFIVIPLSIAVVVSSGIGILQVILQRSVGGVLYWAGERTFDLFTPGVARIDWCMGGTNGCRQLLRAYATFPHPNVFGGFIAVTLPLLVWTLSTQHRSGISRMYYWIVLTMATIALFMTFSRSAWVGLAIGLTGLLHAHRTQSGSAIRTWSIFLGIGVLLYLVAAFFPESGSESMLRRLQLNTAAVDIWRQSPIIGVGAGNFLRYLPNTEIFRHMPYFQPVHNIYLLIVSESGLVGLSVAISLIMYALFYPSNHTAETRNAIKQTYPSVVPFIVLLLIGSVDHYPVTLQQGQLLLALFTGMALRR